MSVHSKCAFLLNSQGFSFMPLECLILLKLLLSTHTHKQVIILLPLRNNAYPPAHNGLGFTAKAAVRQCYKVCQVIIQKVANNFPIISMFLWQHAIFLLLHKAVKQEKITVILLFPCHTNIVIFLLRQKQISICKCQV